MLFSGILSSAIAIWHLSVTVSPQYPVVDVGGTVTFTATPSGGIPPYKIQWYRNSTEIIAVENDTVVSFTFDDVGIEYVKVEVTDSESSWAKSIDNKVTILPPSTTILRVLPVTNTFCSDKTLPGDKFTVNVTVVDVTDLATWQIRVDWNSSLLTYSDIWLPADHVFSESGKAMITPPPDTSPGSVVWGCTYINTPYWTFNGTGILCQVELEILTPPTSLPVACNLTLANKYDPLGTFLLDGAGYDIPFTVEDGIFSYTPPTPNQPPYKPTGLSQYKSDAVTVIPEGGTTPESTIIFKGIVSDPDGDQVRLEIELRQIGEAFTGEPTAETVSDFVPSGTEVTITRYGLVNADYHWQYRAKDSNGATSDWTEFGATGNIDFTVQTPTPIPSPIYGKGIWIHRLSECEGGDIGRIIKNCTKTGVKWIALKGGDGRFLWEHQLNPSVIQQFQGSGIKVFGWQYIYAKYNGGPYNTGGTPEQEAEVANEILEAGVDGFIIDVEDYYEGRVNEATTYLVSIRSEHPGSFIAYCTYSTPEWHPDIPYREFGNYSDAVVPMAYWGATVTPDPDTMVKEMERQWSDLKKAWEEEGNYDSVKPLIPAGWTREGIASESEITRFCKLIYDHGYCGVSLWKYSQMEKEHWEAYAKCFNPQLTVTAYSPVDLIITDPDGLVVSKALNEILGASYMEFDVDGDGDLDDIVAILHRKLGNYSIEVTPEPEATPTDTFSLEVSTRTETIVLAENVTISEIPSEPYVFESTTPPPLSVSMSPISASVLVGKSVTFTSTVSGGYTPYTYQWYLNGAPVSGAKTSSWTFTPPTSGIYYVYLKVTDDMGNTTQSETARITVTAIPIGGYSFPIEEYTTTKPSAFYLALIAILTTSFTIMKRKMHRRTKQS